MAMTFKGMFSPFRLFVAVIRRPIKIKVIIPSIKADCTLANKLGYSIKEGFGFSKILQDI